MIRVHRGRQLPEGLVSPDVYFTPGYGLAASVADGGEWVLLEGFDGAWQVPLILRTMPDGAKDAISPYGYSGVFADPSLSSVQVQEAWASTVASLRDLDVISVLLRHSPLVPQPAELPGLRSIVSGHPTIVLEPRDAESAWDGLRKRCRTKIRKALKNGITGEVREAERQDLEPGGDFRRFYEQTMQRLHAAPFYFFSDDYFRKLFDGLGSNLFIVEIRSALGVVTSSALLMRHEQRLHVHLSCSNLDDVGMGTNNLREWRTTGFAIDHGIEQLHLGGGLEGRDSLFAFKHSFGGRELEYRVSGLIIDDEAYQAHVESRARELDAIPGTLLAAPYFPAYRAGSQ